MRVKSFGLTAIIVFSGTWFTIHPAPAAPNGDLLLDETSVPGQPPETPTGSAPTEAAPSESASPEAVPSETAPAEAAPAETAPAETAPAEAAPAEAAPAEAAPAEAAPGEAAPAETAPAEAAPGNTPPAQTPPTATPAPGGPQTAPAVAPTQPANLGAPGAQGSPPPTGATQTPAVSGPAALPPAEGAPATGSQPATRAPDNKPPSVDSTPTEAQPEPAPVQKPAPVAAPAPIRTGQPSAKPAQKNSETWPQVWRYSAHFYRDSGLYAGLETGMNMPSAEFLNSAPTLGLFVEWRQSRLLSLLLGFSTGQYALQDKTFKSDDFRLEVSEGNTLGIQSFRFETRFFAPIPSAYSLQGKLKVAIGFGVRHTELLGPDYTMSPGSVFFASLSSWYEVIPQMELGLIVGNDFGDISTIETGGTKYQLDTSEPGGNVSLSLAVKYQVFNP